MILHHSNNDFSGKQHRPPSPQTTGSDAQTRSRGPRYPVESRFKTLCDTASTYDLAVSTASPRFRNTKHSVSAASTFVAFHSIRLAAQWRRSLRLVTTDQCHLCSMHMCYSRSLLLDLLSRLGAVRRGHFLVSSDPCGVSSRLHPFALLITC